jgi:hypothetical protein
MSEHECHKDELYEHFGEEQLPEELKREIDSDNDLKREWDELQQIEASLPDESAFGVSDAELDELCAAVDEKIDHANVVSIKRRGILSPTWQRTVTLAATLALVIIGSLLFNQYQPREDQTAATADNEIYSSLMITDDNIELSDPMYNALLMNYSSGPMAQPASMLLDDLTDAEMEYLNENFDVDELML